MSLSDLASLGSFVSGVAVLVSLVFLYFQLRQLSRQVEQAERNQWALVQMGRSAGLSDLNLRLADSAIQEIYNKGMRGDEDMSLTQLGQFRNLMEAVLFNGENAFVLYEAGLIKDDVVEGLRSRVKNNATQPGWRAMWKQLRVVKGKGFREFIDRVAAETPVAEPTDELASWRAAVATERTAVPH